MSCNCGCHDDKAPATGSRKFVPLIVGVVVAGAITAGAVLKNIDKAKAESGSEATRANAATRP